MRFLGEKGGWEWVWFVLMIIVGVVFFFVYLFLCFFLGVEEVFVKRDWMVMWWEGGRLVVVDERGVVIVKLGVDMVCIGDFLGSGDFGDLGDFVFLFLLLVFVLGRDVKFLLRYFGVKSGWVVEVVEWWVCKRVVLSCWIFLCNCFVEVRISCFLFM